MTLTSSLEGDQAAEAPAEEVPAEAVDIEEAQAHRPGELLREPPLTDQPDGVQIFT